jgi:hypothetical protein
MPEFFRKYYVVMRHVSDLAHVPLPGRVAAAISGSFLVIAVALILLAIAIAEGRG